MKLEKMDDFFTKRIDNYEKQMLENVEGCKEGYIKLAQLIPNNCKNLLDLGCGTGLELKEIFKKFPDLEVTGVDLTQAMLDKLKNNFQNKNIKLICGSYFNVDFGTGIFDCIISFQTMHHFDHKSKIELYKKIYSALKPNGVYIECDYIAKNQNEEDYFFSELDNLRKEQNISKDEFVHFDTPCTVDNQIKMFKTAGFKWSQKVWQQGQTAIIINTKTSYMFLETERLILRPWEETDAEDLYKYARHPDVGPIAGWPVHTSIENSREIIHDVLSEPQTFAIIWKESNRPIGSIGLKLGNATDLTDKNDECELGYWLGVPYWGRGIMPEAVMEILRYAFENLKMEKIWCGYYDGNNKSKRVQEKCGFQYQRTTKNVNVPLMNELRTGHVTCMSKEDWLNKNKQT